MSRNPATRSSKEHQPTSLLSPREKILFVSLAILLPTQLAKHWWPEWAFVSGIRIDYLSPTIYLTDLIIGLLLLSELTSFRKINRRWKAGEIMAFAIGIAAVALNIGNALRPMVAVQSWLRLGEIVVLFCYVRRKTALLYPIFIRFLPLATILVALITIVQVVKQSSIGGPLYFLGERSFSVATPGIATVDFMGKRLLRPYATLPHPNALAGFLLVALLILAQKTRTEVRHRLLGRFITSSLAAIPALVLTASQSTYFVASLLFPMVLVRKKKMAIVIAAVLTLVVGLGVSRFLPLEKQSLLLRFRGVTEARILASKNIISGVGLGNYIPALEEVKEISPARTSPFLYYQPVHNIYLLLLTETGLLGSVFGIIVLFKISNRFRQVPTTIGVPILAIALLSFTDHYWITLQQTRLLMTIVLAFYWGKRK